MLPHTTEILFYTFWILLGAGLGWLGIVHKHRRLGRGGRPAAVVQNVPGVRAFNDVELHACSTRADMPSMVRHGLAEAKVRAARGGAWSVEQCFALNNLAPTKRNRLEPLPAELLVLIVEDLDYGSALALSRASHFFRRLAPVDWVSDDDKLDYVLAAEGFKQNRRKQRLACFMCFQLRKKKDFHQVLRTKNFAGGGKWELMRQCRVCSPREVPLRMFMDVTQGPPRV
ncbi:hypothetical protein LTR85_000680 [Meristemomyces frigidus]|nr:hypothetical protein LTR85_000680 [Meristemomyces frigidus]